MGNHGDPAYAQIVLNALANEDENVRAAAAYASRFFKGGEARRSVADLASNDTSELVKEEALKALNVELSVNRDYDQLVKVLLSSKSERVQMAGGIILSEARQRGVDHNIAKAVDHVRDTTPFKGVRDFLSAD